MSKAFLIFLTTISARTAIVMLFLIIGIRLFGKRQIGQMNIYDLALIMALANAVQNAMTGGKGYLSVGIVSAGDADRDWLFVYAVIPARPETGNAYLRGAHYFAF